jgi:TIR domain
MPFRYSCFISYSSFTDQRDDLARNFIYEFKAALDSETFPRVRLHAFVDKEALHGGENPDLRLAQSICESICMICVYTRTYFDKSRLYCAKEFRAMEMIAEQRNARLHREGCKGSIIPVILRAREVPTHIRNQIQFHDFRDFTLAKHRPIARHRKYENRIRDIAEYIEELFEELNSPHDDPCGSCHEFRLPGDEVVKRWVEEKIGLPPQRLPLPGTKEGL